MIHVVIKYKQQQQQLWCERTAYSSVLLYIVMPINRLFIMCIDIIFFVVAGIANDCLVYFCKLVIKLH